jgi:hypothetical protein
VLEPVAQQGAVGKAGEGVVVGEEVEPRLFFEKPFLQSGWEARKDR